MAFTGRLSDWWDGRDETYDAARASREEYWREQALLQRNEVLASRSDYAVAIRITESGIAKTRFVTTPHDPYPQLKSASEREIADVERRLNASRLELEDLLVQTRFDYLQTQIPKLRGKDLVSTTDYLFRLRPAVEQLRYEFAELVKEHRQLLAQSRENRVLASV